MNYDDILREAEQADFERARMETQPELRDLYPPKQPKEKPGWPLAIHLWLAVAVLCLNMWFIHWDMCSRISKSFKAAATAMQRYR